MGRLSKIFALVALSPIIVVAVIAFIPQGFWLPAAIAAVPMIVFWDFRDQSRAELDEIEVYANTTKDHR